MKTFNYSNRQNEISICVESLSKWRKATKKIHIMSKIWSLIMTNRQFDRFQKIQQFNFELRYRFFKIRFFKTRFFKTRFLKTRFFKTRLFKKQFFKTRILKTRFLATRFFFFEWKKTRTKIFKTQKLDEIRNVKRFKIKKKNDKRNSMTKIFFWRRTTWKSNLQSWKNFQTSHVWELFTIVKIEIRSSDFYHYRKVCCRNRFNSISISIWKKKCITSWNRQRNSLREC